MIADPYPFFISSQKETRSNGLRVLSKNYIKKGGCCYYSR